MSSDSTQSEEELFQAVRDHRPGAWARLVERYEGLVLAAPLRLGLAPSDAEDVAQTTWMILYRHLMQIQNPLSLSSWIITTVSREAWRVQRGRAATHESLDDFAADLSDELPSPSEIAEQLERVQAVHAAVESLGERCRALLKLLYFDSRSLPYEEIARELDMKLGSVGPTRLRCMTQLTEKLRARGT